MPQILLIVVVILIAGFTARSCSKNEPAPGDPGKTVAYYEAHPNQAVAHRTQEKCVRPRIAEPKKTGAIFASNDEQHTHCTVTTSTCGKRASCMRICNC